MCNIKITRSKLLIWGILFFLLTNLLKDIMPRGLNQLTGGFIIAITMCCIYPLRKKEIIIFLFVIFSSIVSTFSSEIIGNHIKFVVYFIFNMVTFFLLKRDKNICDILNVIKTEKKILRYTAFIWVSMLGIMFLSDKCYNDNLWGDERYFQAFSVPHGVAGSCCLAISIFLIMILIDQKYKLLYLLDIIISLVGILKAGTRTYLFSAAALLMLALIILVKKKNNRIICTVVGAVGAVVVVLSSESFRGKLEYTLAYRNIDGFSLLDALTSSRTLIWKRDISHFLNKTSLFRQLIGGGFDYSYQINGSWTYRIQAHNGFIEVLLSLGVIGLIIYCILIAKIIKKYSVYSKWYGIVLGIYIPLVVFFDDILGAPSYVMSFIFIVAIFQLLEEKKREIRHDNIVDNHYLLQ